MPPLSKTILPGATIGLLGSGQLGRMFAFEALRMGYKVCVYSPEQDAPAGRIATQNFVAAYEDRDSLLQFAHQVDVVTLEFENIPVQALEMIQDIVNVYPSPHVLYTTQNRLREKTFLREKGFPVVPFCFVNSQETLVEALRQLGYPAVLKTAGFGYDGKGQIVIRSEADLPTAYPVARAQEAIVEQFVAFETELSVVAARSLSGNFAHFGVIENQHRHHILDVSVYPAQIDPAIQEEAIRLTQAVLDALDMVGVMCVEFFLTPDQQLLINELAPRPHNSGHLTIDAAVTSQFEQQLRAICNLPLGSTLFLSSAAMLNLLGDLWSQNEPDWHSLCQIPDLKLHLYGKRDARPRRKMGHLTVLGDSHEVVLEKIRRAKAWLADETCLKRI
jgi:5-(carboxyamino)imidazole ribonucleotide synthase